MPEFTTVIGNLTRDPHYVAASEEGKLDFCAFTIASNPSFDPAPLQTESGPKNRADFIEVEVSGKVAKVISERLKKGMGATVIGERIPMREKAYVAYVDAQGEKKVREVVRTKVRAQSVQFHSLGQRPSADAAPSTPQPQVTVDDIPFTG